VLTSTLSAQTLRDINFSYLYDPSLDFAFEMKIVRSADWEVFYKLQLRDTVYRPSNFIIQWEVRQDLDAKEGIPFSPNISVTADTNTNLEGNFKIPSTETQKIIVAKVVNAKTRRAWMFYRILSPDLPTTTTLRKRNEVLLRPFITLRDTIVAADENLMASYYDDNFPAALPPFAEAQGRVNKGMLSDSTLIISPGQKLRLSMKGLYLFQKDTLATEGVAVRVEDDYPKLSKISSLVGPMVYICTKQEYDRLVLAKDDKKTFDRIVLSITNDTDRARKLMRNYFRRVELANLYFTSYKEGWKTDRGMIFIVFGLPDEVYKFNDREVWAYENDYYRATFNFVKSPSLFDPDNYVLIREKKSQQSWYEVIDLWRNARF
jgi:GWxTD domain-containing protein